MKIIIHILHDWVRVKSFLIFQIVLNCFYIIICIPIYFRFFSGDNACIDFISDFTMTCVFLMSINPLFCAVIMLQTLCVAYGSKQDLKQVHGEGEGTNVKFPSVFQNNCKFYLSLNSSLTSITIIYYTAMRAFRFFIIS